MKKIQIGTSGIYASAVGLGCARMSQVSVEQAREVISASLDMGVNIFDHADAYGFGMSEKVFTDAVKGINVTRDQMILQSKVTIRELDTPRQYYDHRREHILRSVDESLQRLNTDYLDILLLHRPDALTEPEEVAEAFESLRAGGKVRYFGVSNYNRFQIELLQKYLPEKLIVDQVQFNPAHTFMLDAGFCTNMNNDQAVMRGDGGLIEYCRMEKMTIQAYSPFQYGLLEGPFVGSEKYPALNMKLEELSKKYDVPVDAIVIAWILRHPAKMQPFPGSMKACRIREAVQGADIELEPHEWYEVYKASHYLP